MSHYFLLPHAMSSREMADWYVQRISAQFLCIYLLYPWSCSPWLACHFVQSSSRMMVARMRKCLYWFFKLPTMAINENTYKVVMQEAADLEQRQSIYSMLFESYDDGTSYKSGLWFMLWTFLFLTTSSLYPQVEFVLILTLFFSIKVRHSHCHEPWSICLQAAPVSWKLIGFWTLSGPWIFGSVPCKDSKIESKIFILHCNVICHARKSTKWRWRPQLAHPMHIFLDSEQRLIIFTASVRMKCNIWEGITLIPRSSQVRPWKSWKYSTQRTYRTQWETCRPSVYTM